jgi:hypothetical protein
MLLHVLDPVVSLLAKQSAKSLREMEESIGGQLADLTTQRAWIRRALAEKGVDLDGEEPPTALGSASRNGTGHGPNRKRGDTRQAILKLMRTEPARVWLPSEVRDALEAHGIEVTAAAVRVAMRRMGRDNETIRPDDGNGWMLAPDIPSSGEPGTTDLREEAAPV